MWACAAPCALRSVGEVARGARTAVQVPAGCSRRCALRAEIDVTYAAARVHEWWRIWRGLVDGANGRETRSRCMNLSTWAYISTFNTDSTRRGVAADAKNRGCVGEGVISSVAGEFAPSTHLVVSENDYSLGASRAMFVAVAMIIDASA